MTPRLGQRLLLRAAAWLADSSAAASGPSITACALQPPKPKALIAARRGPCRGFHSEAAAGRSRALPASASIGCSMLTCGAAGIVSCSKAPQILSMPGARAGRDQVPELRLQRTELQRMIFAEHRAHADDLLAVADRGARGVALEVLDARRFQARGRIRGAHRALLSRGGRQQPGPAAVVAEPDAAHDAVDASPAATASSRRFSAEHGGAFRGHNPSASELSGSCGRCG